MDPAWISPYHATYMEVETKDGVKLRAVPGIRKSSKIISFRDKKEEIPGFLK